MSKKRILLCNEASFLSTGFSTYGLEVLKRLHATGKYELAELASYGSPTDQRGTDLPWRYYPNMPAEGNKEEQDAYNSRLFNQFGEWRFESVCLDFRPDIVWDIRDWWMLEYQERSPFRPYYKWVIMPTVDAEPQEEQWVATYCNANAVFTYSDWGLETLRHQAGSHMNLRCAAPPGADFVRLNPVQNKRAHKQSVGLPDDALVVGTIMRNQKRKLYPDLVKSFAAFLASAPSELARRTFLYLHTTFPDVGWDIPKLIKENGVGSRVIMTYTCKNCGHASPSFYQDAKAICRRCDKPTAFLPTSHCGVSRDTLNTVLNLFDVYVQYANSEGFGMPQAEAAACGVPVMSIDYSAMSDVVRKLQGVPIKVLAFSRECETGCNRAIPDNYDFISKLQEFLLQPESVRLRMGMLARKACEKHYNYDTTAKIWEDYFDEVVCPEHKTTWGSPAKYHSPNLRIPEGMTNDEFARWGITNIAGRPDMVNSYMALRLTRDLNWQTAFSGMNGFYHNEESQLGSQPRLSPFTHHNAIQALIHMCEHKNQWEKRRVSK